MFKVVGFIVKFLVLSVFILIIGNWAHWDGKTLSEQVESHLSHAEKSDAANTVREWTRKLTDDARGGFIKKGKVLRSHSAVKHVRIEAEAIADTDTISAEASSAQHAQAEQIPSSERQKLRALIRELNGSQSKD